MINASVAIVFWFAALMVGGAVGAWAIWPTAEKHGRADAERHRHRHGDPQVTTLLRLPVADRFPVEPGEWSFFGGAALDVPPGPAEYELLTSEASPGRDESPSDFTRGMARMVDEWTARWEGDTNQLIFGMRDTG